MKRKLKKARPVIIGALGWTSLAMCGGVNHESILLTAVCMVGLFAIWAACMWLTGIFEG